MSNDHFSLRRADPAVCRRIASVLGLLAALALVTACAGSAVTNKGDDVSSSGGSGNNATTAANSGGDTNSVGATSIGGAASTTSPLTTTGVQGTINGSGGSTSVSAATVSGGGGTGGACAAELCIDPGLCVGGRLLVPAGTCCPVCACTGVDCAAVTCEGGVAPIYPGDSCCPVCPAASCAGVECQPLDLCAEGYGYGRPAGACCSGCLPDPTTGVPCLEQVCNEPTCPAGYTAGTGLGGCCHDCVPDAAYCNADSDCVIADRPRSCCACPEAISIRTLEEDACWAALGAPREIPADCFPAFICDALCGACPDPGEARCVEHRCTEAR